MFFSRTKKGETSEVLLGLQNQLQSKLVVYNRTDFLTQMLHCKE